MTILFRPEGEGHLILNSAYAIGSDAWDTGYCEICGDPLHLQERIDAILNTINDELGYYCDACTQRVASWSHAYAA